MLALVESLEKEWKNLFFNMFFVLINAFVVILFFRNNLLTLFILILLAAIYFINYRSKVLLAIFFFGFVAAFLEMLAISFGVWNYSFPYFGNVPIWLFVLWGSTCMVVYRMAIEFERLGLHSSFKTKKKR